jgi:dihydrofolate reductase
LPEWQITADSDEQTYFDITYEFLRYERIKGDYPHQR